MDLSGLSPSAAGTLRKKQSEGAEIANGMVQLMSRFTGRGPTRTRTTVNTNVVVVVFEDALTTAERNL